MSNVLEALDDDIKKIEEEAKKEQESQVDLVEPDSSENKVTPEPEEGEQDAGQDVQQDEWQPQQEGTEQADEEGSNPAKERVDGKKKREKELLQEQLEERNRQLEEYKLELAKIKGRDEALAQVGQPVESVDEDPMPEIDPFDENSIRELLSWQHRQTLKEVEQKYKPAQEQIQKVQQTVQQTQFDREWSRMNEDLKQGDPKYKVSYDFLMDKLRERARQVKPNASKVEIDIAVADTERQFVSNAVQNGMSVAAAVKAEAIAAADQYGVDIISMMAEAGKEKKQPVSGSRPNIEEISKNKQRSGSFIEADGAGGRVRLGAKELASQTMAEMSQMSDYEYDKAFRQALKEAKELDRKGQVI